jgi:hypothetical protein
MQRTGNSFRSGMAERLHRSGRRTIRASAELPERVIAPAVHLSATCQAAAVEPAGSQCDKRGRTLHAYRHCNRISSTAPDLSGLVISPAVRHPVISKPAGVACSGSKLLESVATDLEWKGICLAVYVTASQLTGPVGAPTERAAVALQGAGVIEAGNHLRRGKPGTGTRGDVWRVN